MNRDFVLAASHGPLRGHLTLPPAPEGLVLAARLHDTLEPESDLAAHRLAILSMPLLSESEMRFPDAAYNVPLLTQRILDLLELIRRDGDTESLPLGIFAAGHGAPAAIRAAARRDTQVRALACHGGLLDLAGLENLKLLAAPILMVTDPDDAASRTSFQRAASHISPPHRLLTLQPGEGPGSHVAQWFWEHFQAI